MFTKTYLETIDPLAEYSRLFSEDVLCSVVVHTVLYYLGIQFLFPRIGLKVPTQLPLILMVVMCAGYIGRLTRSKDIYKSMIGMENAREKTISLMHAGYFRYFFLG